MIYSVKNLHFGYRRNGPEVLRGIDLELEEGELLTVLGRNGCGKSTLFGCMLGLLKPSSGHIEICSRELSSMKPREIASVIGYVPQNHTPAFAYTVREFVVMGCAAGIGLLSHPGAAEEERAALAIEEMGMSALADKPYTELSGGERQLASIARAIAGSPKAILFDEPMAHLDLGNTIKTLRVIKKLSQQGYAVAVTTHDPNHALLLGGKTLLFGSDGRGRYGPTGEMVTEENLCKLYGEQLSLRYIEEFGREICISPMI